MTDKTINTLWHDFKDFMYLHEAEHLIDVFWDFLETHELFATEELLQEHYNNGHEAGYDDGSEEGHQDGYDNGYRQGYEDAEYEFNQAD